jgi:hypothetical protein
VQLKKLGRFAVTSVTTVMLCACASGPDFPGQGFKRIEIVAVESKPPPKELSDEELVAAGAAGGAVAGIMSSAMLSLACGPAFAACFAAGAGMSVGAGAVAGGAIAMTGLSEEERAIIQPVLESRQNDNRLSQELASAVSQRMPAKSIALSDADADAKLELALQSLQFSSVWGLNPSFYIVFEASYDWQLNQKNSQHAERRFWCTTSRQPLEDWIAAKGALIDQELGLCLDEVADQIHATLTRPLPQESDSHPAFRDVGGES